MEQPTADDAVLRAERRAEQQWARAERWREKFDSLLRVKRADMALLDRILALLREGDVAAAIDLLAERERAREAAKAKREEHRRARVGGVC